METTADVAALREVLLGMIRGMANQPDRVNVLAESAEDGLVFRVRLSGADADRLNSQNGRTLRSLRVILAATAANLDCALSRQALYVEEDDPEEDGDA
jgi:predicted RNA-binding protein YlqC (UPF0109 family)